MSVQPVQAYQPPELKDVAGGQPPDLHASYHTRHQRHMTPAQVPEEKSQPGIGDALEVDPEKRVSEPCCECPTLTKTQKVSLAVFGGIVFMGSGITALYYTSPRLGSAYALLGEGGLASICVGYGLLAKAVIDYQGLGL